jgi:hypothetical protein
MLPDGAKRRAAEIREFLPWFGWSIVEIERPFEDEWWADEIWHLESVVPPRGTRAFLTFVPPMEEGKWTWWEVCASKWRPIQRPLHGSPIVELSPSELEQHSSLFPTCRKRPWTLPPRLA